MGERVKESKAEKFSVRRPAKPESTARKCGINSLGAVIDAREQKFVSGGIKDVFAIRHPGCVVGQNAGHAKGAASASGNEPESLLRFRR